MSVATTDNRVNVSRTQEILTHNRQFIPGGMASVNRGTDPPIAFARGQGAYLWDVDGKRYPDYHAGFAPYILGHNEADINEAVTRTVQDGLGNFGSGPAEEDGDLVELFLRCVPTAAYGRLEDALAHWFDLAVVATPAPLHVPLALQLAEHRINLLVEKPLSLDLAGLPEFEAQVNANDIVVGVAYPFRAHPALTAMRASIIAGRFGDPLQVTVVAGQHFPTYRPAYQEINYRDCATGGGAIQDALTHMINAVEWIVGPTTGVVADAEHLKLDGDEVEDTAHVIARNGKVLATYSLNQHQPANALIVTVICERRQARFEGHRARWSWLTEVDGTWQEEICTIDRDTLWGKCRGSETLARTRCGSFEVTSRCDNWLHHAVQLDHLNADSVVAGFAAAVNAAGKVDILINIGHEPTVITWHVIDTGEFTTQLANAAGYFQLAKELRDHAVAREAPARIVLLASMYGTVRSDPSMYEGVGPINPVACQALKGGIIQMARHLAVHWASERGRVNCLSPRPFPNEGRAPQKLCRRLAERTPLKRIGSPEELKCGAVFLASDASSYVTGHNLVVDGGWTAW